MRNGRTIHGADFVGRGAAARDRDAWHYLRLLVLIMIVFIGAAALLYPERFLLRSHPFSYLGGRQTPQGLRNLLSRLVYDGGMLLCALTMYLLARYYHRKHPVPVSHTYELLSYLSALGYVFMVAPCDVESLRFPHSLGSGLVVGSHLFLTLFRLLALRHSLGTKLILVLLALLLVPVLMYAGMWATGHPAQALYQKPAFAVIIILELYAAYQSRIHGEIRILRYGGSFDI